MFVAPTLEQGAQRGKTPVMSDDAVSPNAEQVGQLLAAQFPDWAGLTIRPVASDGTDNVLFRLGQDKCIRLPRMASTAAQLTKEVALLPLLKDLPLAVPEPLGTGGPAYGYPYPWAVYRWIEGVPVIEADLPDMAATAETLGCFVNVLRSIDVPAAPLSGPANNHRGVELSIRDKVTRRSLAGIADLYDEARLNAAWDQALQADKWDNAPVLIHGDIHAANLLARDRALSAVIDFGLAGRGDPAVDLIVGWSLLDTGARDIFRVAAGVDEPTWQRGRGWALSTAVVALAYYRERNPFLWTLSRRSIEAVLADAG